MLQLPPPDLLEAFEKFYLDVTQDLDPYFALALTNLSKQAVTTAYLMGLQDAQKCPCPVCQTISAMTSSRP